ncbi:hypothetical protein H112_05664 [Trichophyton rubrum D6]|uniref:Uncharacterized protein n=3 Tax=Trichophyton TaxID=5550 RepID=F2SK34_TRIRC|nr:uncharacterized protein TERG_03387 [Trichophyton rubrum CBS 118892]EZF16669.1 hypothetical protein H100_05681 [Trichophyton rubrum MR850]EZF40350.1 hypothetical protein H102_05650 [Trichophyton rubrum CBS 100081]EZF50855.1 hypothetical protein H103_05677 [Trichophyton rubrum CBS 288.86]EZF61573.1 hypothetical protein H104_05662 [Trichophyton rubrum CBS 289.86]EZF72336.1 hypothetical protein H105_05690 [Trichophyton soudanense CBS 452.61]EZF82995.1 hypothetical protein H110_05672 [Trichophy
MSPVPTVSSLRNIWDRVAELQAMINNPEISSEQKINIQTAIDLYYKSGQPIPRVCIQGGKVICLQDLDFSRPFWMEGYGQQLSAHTVIPAAEISST